jgi:2-haloacid dehalogenase
MYYGRWEEMLGDSIEDTVEVLNQLLKNPDYRVAALTNWSAETFPVALDRFEFLHRFEGIVVSGAENTRKPFADIYQLTLDRFDFKAEESLFIDDNLRNVEAASNMGIHTIHFKNPKELKLNLEAKAIRL